MSEDQAEMLRALHDEHSAALWRFVLRLTGDRQLAEDVVQEALLRAWKHPEILAQGEAAARSWLYTVARNIVIDDRRSARHNREFGTDEVPERAHGDRTDQVLDAWLLSEALGTLSHDHRAVIVHAYYGGRTVGEIAELLGIAPGTVKSRMHYGMRALKLALQEKGVTEP
ncbi:MULTISPECIES: sigma-70 family RNA polymerase sigma factor [unclassified Rathayibacter]|uniref:sigma-70 family RNA polymerase sigma factor n=1 Tax=unclassified Rathayibacter TaxID=2609250 RepID=UPI001049EB93|nr:MULTISPECIES: sigma-70 family RNA polymerase sigma factor [unclassified Rathayibacter]MCJ1672633.1 sigma-70 family RNA polymerase sigma factor [Rathayibacter sp. VKM Ac-2929]MCJ1682112.1 sigma-70 family RNA polymerase sigma factor [Rathayibacter sp. VKM Ac-2928]MCJ1685945.1 sigma-70 family RNA polymerase sigma factor [Rathayibacter sp. VKM Ac-2927]TCL84703.1 RNA polymerase sigma-70 factor (ECF subfamily) [Rathayibacter sp. PhB192]TCM30421.1 RNA polymerase sigma-70 factor (ECF subfamily) [Ra